MFKIVKKKETYTDKASAEVKKVWRYYVLLGNLRVQIRPSFKDDAKVLYSYVPLDDGETVESLDKEI